MAIFNYNNVYKELLFWKLPVQNPLLYANNFSSPMLCRQHNAVINHPQSHETRRDCTTVGNFVVQILSVIDLLEQHDGRTVRRKFTASTDTSHAPRQRGTREVWYGTTLSVLFALPRFKGTRAPNCIPPRLIHLMYTSIYKSNTHRPVDFDSVARTHGHASRRSSERRASILFIE